MLTPPLQTMSIAAQESALTAKTRELCEAILQDSEYLANRRRIDSFLSNEPAKELYRNLAEKGE